MIDLNQINERFSGFMGEVMRKVTLGSHEWHFAKKVFIGGLAAGMSLPKNERTLAVLERAFEKANVDSMIALASPEHVVDLPGDERGVTEAGMIEIATRMEDINPEDAERIRTVRYQLSKLLREVKEQ